MRRATGCVWLGSVVLFAALFGCSSSGDGGGGGTPDEVERTVAAGEALSRQFSALCAAEGWPAATAGFATWAAAQPEVAEVEVHPESQDVTVVYDSGVYHIFHPNDQVGEVEVAGGRNAAPPAGRGRFIPARATATAATSHPSGVENYAEVVAEIQTMLDAADEAGYSVPATAPDATVDWFRSWGDHGLILFHGHGGWRRVRGDDIYTVQTSERFNSLRGPGARHWGDLIARRMGFWSTEGDESQDSFTVNTRFLEHYCPTMTAGGIVYFNACHSLERTADPAGVLCDNGTEVVVGWDGLCPRLSGAHIAQFFFDRLLGFNDIRPQSPPTRPFTYDDVRAAILATMTTTFMFDRDEDGTLETPGAWASYRGAAGETTTSGVPVVTGGYFMPQASTNPRPFVNLTGYFGRPQQQVLLGGTALNVMRWTETEISAEVPLTGDDATGDLFVRANGLNSNPVRLTRWLGTIDVTVNEPGEISGWVDVLFGARGLTQRLRDEVDHTPDTAVGPFDACHVYEDTGTISWDISGEWTDRFGDHHEVEAAGNAEAVSTAASPPADVGCILVLDLDSNNPANRRYQLMLSVIVTGTETVTHDGVATTRDWVGVYAHPDYTAPAALPTDWRIPGGTITGDGYEMTWTELEPDPAPSVATMPAR